MPKRITDFPLKSTVSYTDAIPIIDLDNPAVPANKRIPISVLLNGFPDSFVASGDLSGTGLSQKVIAIQNIPISSEDPTDGQYLAYDSVDGYWAPVTLPPASFIGFSAGGDLSGTITSQNVNAIRSATTAINVSSATAPSAGQVLTATSSVAATWQFLVNTNTRGFVTGQTFTSNGSWTAPSGVTHAIVCGWGGGGGGGGGGDGGPYLGPPQAGSGGGGAIMNTMLITVVPGTTYTITIGSGGSGAIGSSNKGSDGNNTTFGSLATFAGAGGGNGGESYQSTAGNVYGYGGLSNKYQSNTFVSELASPSMTMQSGGSARKSTPFYSYPGGACLYGSASGGAIGATGASDALYPTSSGGRGGGGGGCGGDGSVNGSAGGEGGSVYGGGGVGTSGAVGASASNNSGNGGGGGGAGWNNANTPPFSPSGYGGNGGAGGSGKLIVSWFE